MRLLNGILLVPLFGGFSVVVSGNAQADPLFETSVSPIMVGGNADRDACDAWATVMPLNPNGDGYLAVRYGPAAKGLEKNRLKSGHPVMICNISKSGKWAGVVYPANPEDDLSTCGLSSPDARPRHPYNGPCKSGWVARRYLWLSAG